MYKTFLTEVVTNSSKIKQKFFVEYDPSNYGYSYGESQDFIYEFNKENKRADIQTMSYTKDQGYGDVYYVTANKESDLREVMGWLGEKYPNIQKR